VAIAINQPLLEELPKAGMPAPVLDPWIVENRLNDGVLVDMAHIIGTTRMSDDPRTGVVDAQGKVHGVNGLYIVGSSVFPTSSHVNPTLMIVSLAIRTADQIKMILSAVMGRFL
jgi:choline dehydrogenase-like flavoprotein